VGRVLDCASECNATFKGLECPDLQDTEARSDGACRLCYSFSVPGPGELGWCYCCAVLLGALGHMGAHANDIVGDVLLAQKKMMRQTSQAYISVY
jgi:hypothetical protein